MDIKNHKISNIQFLDSPNFNTRPRDAIIDLVVIHCISLPRGEYKNTNVEKFFLNELDQSLDKNFEETEGLKVSSHLYIKRDGKIIQFVPFNKRAWHAGKSCYEGSQDCNNNSIGIELQGTDTSEFEVDQYNSLVKVLKLLFNEYPNITPRRVVGHSDIAPGRKTDPGHCFDWSILKELK